MKYVAYITIGLLVLFGLNRDYFYSKRNVQSEQIASVPELKEEQPVAVDADSLLSKSDTIIFTNTEISWFVENGMSELPYNLKLEEQLAFREFINSDNQEEKKLIRLLDSLLKVNPNVDINDLLKTPEK